MRISGSLLVASAATLALAQDPRSEKQLEPAPEIAQEEIIEQAPRDTLRVYYPVTFASEADYADWINRRATTLKSAADQAPGAPRRIELLLAAANRLLASGTEHAASTRILGIEQEEMPDLNAIRSLFERAQSLLDAADALLQANEQTATPGTVEANEQDDAATQVWHELALRRDTIQSFAQALHAYLLDTGGDDDARAKRRAASLLSTLRESDSPEIAAAARLWQALLRSTEKDPSRALSIIGPVTAPPRVGSQPYQFYGVILRARLLAEHRSPTLALAMLMRAEELVETWFSRQRDRGQALRTTAFTRVAIMQTWATTLTQNEGNEEEVAWCQAGILALQEDWLTRETPRLLRLTPAIPLLVAPKDLGVDDPEPAEDNADDQ